MQTSRGKSGQKFVKQIVFEDAELMQEYVANEIARRNA